MLTKYSKLKSKNVAEMKKRNDGTVIVEAKQFDQDTGEETGLKVFQVVPSRLLEKKQQLEDELEAINETLADYDQIIKPKVSKG